MNTATLIGWQFKMMLLIVVEGEGGHRVLSALEVWEEVLCCQLLASPPYPAWL